MAPTIISTSVSFQTNLLQKMVAAGNAAAVRSILATNSDSANIKDYLGWMSLHIAALTGQNDIAETLLLNQAMRDSQNDVGNTPLHWAAFLDNASPRKSAVEYGAKGEIYSPPKNRGSSEIF